MDDLTADCSLYVAYIFVRASHSALRIACVAFHFEARRGLVACPNNAAVTLAGIARPGGPSDLSKQRQSY